jgi:hypothetical protein
MKKFALTACLPALAGLLLATTAAWGHPPNWEAHPVRPRIDVIPPLGNHLPPSYARRYNRPAYVTGMLAYWIAPTSREAISWHRAAHRGYYANHAPRMETHYFFPKPWQIFGGASKAAAEPHAADGAGPHASTKEPHPAEPAPAGIELAPPIELLPPPEIEQ